jgi:hypothetical protein
MVCLSTAGSTSRWEGVLSNNPIMRRAQVMRRVALAKPTWRGTWRLEAG